MLACTRTGSGRPVVLLHGWPGDRHDWDAVVPLLDADVVVPDLRGFGDTFDPLDAPDSYSASAQASAVLSLLSSLDIGPAVFAGYDIGSRVAQTIARSAPAAVSALVLAPPLPGPGRRVLDPSAQREFWYQPFHQLDLSASLLDGSYDAVRTYLEHFWTHWSGPSFTPSDAHLDRLTELYARPGAFTASIGWYRSGSGTVATALTETPPPATDRLAAPTTVLWPAHDPLFPYDWSDQLDAYFVAATLHRLDDAGHFSPLEAPSAWAEAIGAHAGV
jgi:pimeloyl-ACP methyl ester carboxylesterase